ncbi:F0F1 ATP synthase subunit A [Phormidium sp. CCY1219]|uniref:F0F1 ATP synthase subunit A n=1 Tax=Phormidium sp. CCY1219 TaxID=2886104 RepID=UPI002D1E7474|nr:F0F1 ATP synthase subunit A [Phormidium sp. CCY1219]MEB3829608.1 F0F1 ATP synthase subunit A [Phormidium sp. CCY1219]
METWQFIDNIIYWQWNWVVLNATLVFTWLVMAILVIGSWLVTRNLAIAPDKISPWQNMLEIIVKQINDQIREGIGQEPKQFLPFVGTLFLFIALANILTLFPYYESPAASLSSTAAWAICVFFAVPYYGIKNVGWRAYFKHYIQPTPIMLPFQIISELSRTLSLAVRLFGNIMSTSLLVAILISLVPLFLPMVMRAFGILIGVIQAYVFAILALVYIASGMSAQHTTKKQQNQHSEQGAS